MKLSEIKSNPDNPRVIKDDKFKRLCNSIKDFPKMMELRPIVIDADNVVLGGNMRLKALQFLGFKEVPNSWVKRADTLTDEEKKRFIITDNAGFGEWDWDVLANEWEQEQLIEWGLDIPNFEPGDIVELEKITTTYNLNIKCKTPEELEDMKLILGVTANSIDATRLKYLLK